MALAEKASDGKGAAPASASTASVDRRAFQSEQAPDRFRLPVRAAELAPGSTPGVAQVDAVRRALYQALPVSFGGHVMEFPHRATYAEAAEQLNEQGGGVWCAGTAFVLQRALEELGYRVWTLHFGFDDDVTHAVNLVAIGDRIVVQDAYLNESIDTDARDLLQRLQQGAEPSIHRETRDRKIHLIPRDYEDKRDLDWYTRNAELELPPSGAFRRFVLVPNGHRDRVMRSWTGRNAERLAKLALPAAYTFLMLNPIGVFDGERFESAPDRMPVIQDWLQRGGHTLSQQLHALELSDPEASEASSGTLRVLINRLAALQAAHDEAERQFQTKYRALADEAEQRAATLTQERLGHEDALRQATQRAADERADLDNHLRRLAEGAATERARHETELRRHIETAAGDRLRQDAEIRALKEEAAADHAAHVAEARRLLADISALRAQFAAERESDFAAYATLRTEFAALSSERESVNASLAEARTDRDALIGTLEEYERRARVAVETAERARDEAEKRASMLDKRAAQLEGALASIVSEFKNLDRADDNAKGGPEQLAVRSARRLVADLYSNATRTKLLERNLAALQEERREMMTEINHLTAVVNNSRYLRIRRAINRLLGRS